MQTKIAVHLAKGASVAALMLGSSLAFAQDAGAPGAVEAADAADAGVADIVVTAERRASSVQKTPIAITAVGGQSLRDSGITGIDGLNNQIPNLNFERNAGDAMIFIRGIGYNSISPGGEARVALYLDGAYQSRTQAGLLGFYDVDRVEVLRGPQGTLYGRNAIAGTINVLTRAPGDTLNGYFTGTLGTYGQVGTEGAVGGALSDTIGARIAFRTVDRNGFGTNLNTGEDVGDEQSRSVRGKLHIEPSSTIRIGLTADYSKIDDHAGGYRYGGPGNFAIVPLGIALGGAGAVPSDKQDSASFGPREKIETYGFAGQADVELSDSTTVTLLTAFRHLKAYQESNTDGFIQELSRQYITEKSDVFTQEVRLAQKIGDVADIIIGGYYFREKNSALNEVPHKGLVLQLPNTFGANTPFGPLTAGLDPNAFYDFYATFGRVKTTAYAVFAQANVHLTDQLELVLGGRYSDETKRLFEGKQLDLTTPFVQGNQLNPGFNPMAGLLGGGPLSPGGGFLNQKKGWSSFDPKVTLSYQATPTTLLYATWSRGFKSGGFNIGGLQAPFRPEKLTNYEAGVKADLLDRRLRANISAFNYDYKELQQSVVDGLGLVTRNAATARLRGVEVELTARPTEELTIALNGSHLDGKFKDFVNADPAHLERGVQDLRGNQLPNAPKWQVGGDIGYAIETRLGRFTPRVNVTWFDKVYFNEFNTAELIQPSRTMVNLYLNWEGRDASWSFSAFVKNLTDDTYIVNSATSNGLLGFPNTAYFGAPRTAGISVTKTF
ncbi:TonB-dependent receptor [Sphingomonadaceae bacterium G21617-S1]|nr:TonB-dependent receptor [Sphingomonadaceae bacterium G21617-S1]